jgi:ADP-ribose pyrophosphatase YjhB (NUDIX family)
MSPSEEIRDVLRRFHRRGIRRWGSQRAAVAVTVVIGAEGPAVLLTRRADSLGAKPGQLALPGWRTGRWESASRAAGGQLAEEFGIHLPPQSALGSLDDCHTPSRIVITPVVLWAGSGGFQQEFLAVPFTDLDVEPVFVASAESDRPMIRLPLNGEWLLAPTAAILHQFREVVIHRRRTRVAHFSPLPHSAG